MAYSEIKPWLLDELQSIRDSGMFKDEKIIKTSQGAQVDTQDGPNINFCANNYLGKANHPDIIEAVTEGLHTHGFGMASVRFICGTQDIHKQLEGQISEFLGTEDTSLYSSCFDANTGLFETILTADDAIISDSLKTTRIIDGNVCARRKGTSTSTLGKALGGASGGFTSGRKEIIDFLRQRSRPYLFSNTLAPSMVTGALKALEMVRHRPELRETLWENTDYFRAHRLCLEPQPSCSLCQWGLKCLRKSLT